MTRLVKGGVDPPRVKGGVDPPRDEAARSILAGIAEPGNNPRRDSIQRLRSPQGQRLTSGRW